MSKIKTISSNSHFLKFWLIALILYLPTLGLVGAELYLLFLPAAVIFYKEELVGEYLSIKENGLSKRTKFSLIVFGLLSCVIILNVVINAGNLKLLFKTPVIYAPLLLLGSYLIADVRVFRALFVLIVIEILVGWLEYLMGVNSFYKSLSGTFSFVNYDLFYHTRVFGLSVNSSFLAQKSMVGFISILFLKIELKNRQKILLYLLFVSGIILTFGRTSIVVFLFALVIFIFIFTFYLLRKKLEFTSINKWLGYTAYLTLTGLIFTFYFWQQQFTRMGLVPRFVGADGNGLGFINGIGLDKIDMSGRKEMWAKSINFISENFWFGNGSERFTLNATHVHSSVFEVITTHGMVVFALLTLLIIINLRKSNFLFIGMILLYSIGQYGIFWNISFLDLVFYAVLFFGIRQLNASDEFGV
ncbi:MAG: O-antigen ligase family protein [Crocinitomicaceae bacterium]|nr:O-antigen ligase family protein [Crocinitomicaceae bacterium]